MLFCSRSPDRPFDWNQSEYLHNLQLYRLRRWRLVFVVLRPIWIYVITSDVLLMLDHSLRRWPNIISTVLVVMICIQYCLSFAPSDRPGQHLLVSIIPSWEERSLIACDLVAASICNDWLTRRIKSLPLSFDGSETNSDFRVCWRQYGVYSVCNDWSSE